MAADKVIRNSKLDTFLSKLATKLTAIFWRKAETTQVGIDDTPTAGSNNLVKSGGVQSALAGKQDTISDLATIRSGAAAGATAYQKPGTGIPDTDIADGVIPDVSNFITKSVNDLVNYYLKSEVYTKDEVAAFIGAIQKFHYEIYASTSAVSEPVNYVLYLIGPTGSGADKYEEYVYDSTKQEPWIKIGDTSIDLSQYVTITALNTALANYTATADLGALALKDTVSLSKGSGDNVLGESTNFTNSSSAVSFSGGSNDTFVKSYPGVKSKMEVTTVPNVTSVGAASTWNFAMGTGDKATTLIISGGNSVPPTLGVAKNVATGSLTDSGNGASVMTGLGTPTTASAVTGIGTAEAAAQTISVGANDKVKVAKYDDLGITIS